MLGTCQSTATHSTSGSWEASEIAVPEVSSEKDQNSRPKAEKSELHLAVALHLRDAAGCIQEHQNLRKVVLRAVGSGGGAPHMLFPPLVCLCCRFCVCVVEGTDGGAARKSAS